MKRVTLKDIALHTNLDVSTVSRVLNEDPVLRIGPARRAHVLQTAAELGYVANRAARSLRMKKSFIVGYVMTDAGGSPAVEGDFNFPVVRARLAGLEEAVSQQGYLLGLVRLLDGGVPAIEEKVILRQQFDGLIFNWTVPSPDVVERLQFAHLPAVLLDPRAPPGLFNGRLSCVVADRAEGVRRSVAHLAARGHRRVAFISTAANTQRLAGYRSAAEALDLDTDSRLVKLFDSPIGNLSGPRSEGCRAMHALLDSGVEFTAVQAGSDATAAGILDALRKSGTRVPEDVAVMGYDDLEGYSANLLPEPFLSTVRDPNREMGLQAAELLLDQVERNEAPRQVVLEPELILRRSA